MAEHINGLGGEEAIGRIKSFRRTAEVEIEGEAFTTKGTGKVVEAVVVGKKNFRKLTLNDIETSLVWDGEKEWTASTGQPTEELSLGVLQSDASVSPLVGLVAAIDPTEIKITELDFEGIKCNAIRINKFTFYLGKEDKLLHGMSGPTGPDGNESPLKFVYSEFKTFDGVKFPTKTVSTDGTTVITTTYNKTEINPDLEESLFKKP